MKRASGWAALLGVATLCAFAGPLAAAELKTVGSGEKLNFDPSGFREDMKPKFEIMRVKCVKCHTMERTIVAIKTGVALISGQPFDKLATKTYGIKMLRKPNSDMNKQEIRDTVILLNYLLDENAKD